jgi:hypothetical protein
VKGLPLEEAALFLMCTRQVIAQPATGYPLPHNDHGMAMMVVVVVVVMPTAVVVVRLCICRGRKEGDESA